MEDVALKVKLIVPINHAKEKDTLIANVDIVIINILGIVYFIFVN